MIYGKLDCFEAMGLASLGDAVAHAVEWIRGLPADLEEGRLALDGDQIYALVVRCATVSPVESRFETHRRYVDLHYTLAGLEVIEWASRDALANDGEYDSEKDVLYHKPGPALATTVNAPGYFSIFTPTDAHRPAIRIEGNEQVFKLVVKIAIERFGMPNHHERFKTQPILA